MSDKNYLGSELYCQHIENSYRLQTELEAVKSLPAKYGMTYTDDESVLWNFEVVLMAKEAALEAARAEIERLQPKPFTVTVEIPECGSLSQCSGFCEFLQRGYMAKCSRFVSLFSEGYCYPGPGCPRHKKGGEV